MFEMVREIVKKQNQLRKIKGNLLKQNKSILECSYISNKDDEFYYLLRDIIFLVDKSKKDFSKLAVRDIVNLYLGLAENYSDFSSILRMREGIEEQLIKSDYDFDDFQIKAIKDSIFYLKEGLSYIDYLFKNHYHLCGEKLKMGYDAIYSDIAMCYLLLRDYENYEKTLIKGLDYRSLECSISLVNFYVNNFEYLKALNYYDIFYELIKECHRDPDQELKIEEIFENLSSGLIDRGYYTNAELICRDAVKYFKSNPFNKEKYIQYFGEELSEKLFSQNNIDEIIIEYENKIKECRLKTSELSNIKINDNILNDKFEENVISLMDNDVKVYINTSLGIYDMIRNNEKITFDYSSCLMPIMKAVESILFNIIGDNYLSYLKSKIKNNEEIDLSYIDSHLKYSKNGGIHLKEYIDFLEYGTVLHTIADKYNSKEGSVTIIPNKYFVEFCSRSRIESPEEIILDFYDKLSVIREKRNKVAHRKRVTENDAKITYDYLIDNFKFIKFLYTNFSFCFIK